MRVLFLVFRRHVVSIIPNTANVGSPILLHFYLLMLLGSFDFQHWLAEKTLVTTIKLKFFGAMVITESLLLGFEMLRKLQIFRVTDCERKLSRSSSACNLAKIIWEEYLFVVGLKKDFRKKMNFFLCGLKSAICSILPSRSIVKGATTFKSLFVKVERKSGLSHFE